MNLRVLCPYSTFTYQKHYEFYIYSILIQRSKRIQRKIFDPTGIEPESVASPWLPLLPQLTYRSSQQIFRIFLSVCYKSLYGVFCCSFHILLQKYAVTAVAKQKFLDVLSNCNISVEIKFYTEKIIKIPSLIQRILVIFSLNLTLSFL